MRTLQHFFWSVFLCSKEKKVQQGRAQRKLKLASNLTFWLSHLPERSQWEVIRQQALYNKLHPSQINVIIFLQQLKAFLFRNTCFPGVSSQNLWQECWWCWVRQSKVTAFIITVLWRWSVLLLCVELRDTLSCERSKINSLRFALNWLCLIIQTTTVLILFTSSGTSMHSNENLGKRSFSFEISPCVLARQRMRHTCCCGHDDILMVRSNWWAGLFKLYCDW